MKTRKAGRPEPFMGYSRDTPGTSPKNSIPKLVSVVELIKVKVTVDTFVAYFII
jgi:hypothetical protein